MAAAAAAAAAAEGGTSSRWSTLLHPDLIPQIGWRVLANDLLDYVRFRAVCALWRSRTISPRGRGLVDSRLHPRRWQLLPEGYDICPGHSSLLGYVRFFNLSTGFFVRAWLPILHDNYILDVVDGLVLLLQKEDNNVRLLNPLTGDTADLPPLVTPHNLSRLGSRYLMCFREVGATSVTVGPDGLIMVMIVLPLEHRVAFTTAGRDREWTFSTWSLSSIQSSIPFKGMIYILSTEDDNEPQIFQIDPPRHDETGSAGLSSLSPPKLVAICSCKIQPPYYLVECDSHILVVGCCDGNNSSQMLVYRLYDLILDTFEPITSIGGCVLFANVQNSLSVSGTALPTIAGDTIVKYIPGTKHLGSYHLQSATWFQPTDEYPAERGLEPSSDSLIYRLFWRYYNYNG
jgi:hypothetical protein